MLINISDLSFQRPTWAEIDLDIFSSNYLAIREAVQPARVLAVVKADAYGHGAIVLARELHQLGIERLGTATALEAIELRKAGIRTPVVVLSGMTVSQLPLLLQYDLIPAVYDFEFLKALDEFTEKHRREVAVHLKVDTGMGRLGFQPDEAAIAFKKKYSYVRVEGVYTHFANADVPEDNYTRLQLQRFLDFCGKEDLPVRYRHAANSAGIINFPESHLDLVRPGLVLYGLSPASGLAIPQRPILSLKSRIIALRHIAKGETIGYGRTFRAARDSVIATVPFGYADGLRRNLSNRLEVEVCGKLCRIAGTISMDLCMLDVTDVANQVKLQEEVTFIGTRTTCWDWARLLDTIPYEITCLIGARVPRVYVKNGQVCDVYYP
ncbi:alanine racemase [bacterium]|nr:alanine racemase [bacterium]MCI0604626.1 alanine racemase [bacterium]